MVNFEDTITSIQIDYAKRKVFVTGRCKARDLRRMEENKDGER